jgi:hypothetical protein
MGKCNIPIFARYTWPGKDEKYCCLIHATMLEKISAAMGFHLQIIPLITEQLIDALERN